jgi:hypothetical protein
MLVQAEHHSDLFGVCGRGPFWAGHHACQPLLGPGCGGHLPVWPDSSCVCHDFIVSGIAQPGWG